MQSLLGQFYNKIKGSQEDIASESLTYILKNSISARKTINQIVNIDTGLNFSDLSYSVQNVGKELERPDISGKDESGKEVLLIEAKFWASLTNNQPNGYLKRLSNDTGLIFLVPKLRVRVVFEEVIRRIKESYSELEINLENHIIKINISNQYILIKDWNEILNAVKLKLVQENNQSLVSDIDQVIGFVDIIDKNSFQPITDNDLSPQIPKKINSYFDIVDKVVDELKKRTNNVNTKGLTIGQSKNYYRRYFVFGNFGLGIGLMLGFWSEYADTPFWLSIKMIEHSEWIVNENLKQKCEKIAFQLNIKLVEKENEIFLSLKPKLYETEDIVVNDLANQITKIHEKLI